MMSFAGEWSVYLVLLFAGVIPNGIWRVAGFIVGRRISEDSEFLVWVRAVATAILAGVIAQLLLNPPGLLASVPSPVRYGATVAGFLAYLAFRKSVVAAVIVGEIALIGGKWWTG